VDFLNDVKLPQDEPVGALSPQDWMDAPETVRVLAALSADGARPRFVGGCVRDALAHRPVNDIDLATPDPPERVLDLLGHAGLRAIPTGLAHGTVTAQAGDRQFEITTLRRDVETDGRHAKVSFTDDWIADAARRDFTINALSCRPDGMIYDPFGGIADLATGCIRFVGEARLRIDEDLLRILRFFRFYAHFGRPPADEAALEACRSRAARVGELSGERVAAELLKLLSATDPLPALLLMQGAGVLAALSPALGDLARLRTLVFLESRGVMRPSLQPDPVRRLSALLPADKDAAAAVAVRLRLSNADSDRLCRLAAPDAWPDRRQPAADQRRMIYRLGADAFRDLTLLAWAAARASEGYGPSGDSDRWMALLDLADSWTAPNFPLTGTDALALGIKPGPRIGQILRQLETDWQDRDFIPDRAALLEKLATLSRLPPPA